MVVILSILAYCLVLLAIGRWKGSEGNDAFFRGNGRSPWMLVAFGMVGASISGVTFIGVPGWAMGIDMTYMQMCLGFIVGYLVVAFVLLPMYYEMGGVSIYGYLERRFGRRSYRTGAGMFVVSKMLGGAAKFYVVCEVLGKCLGNLRPADALQGTGLNGHAAQLQDTGAFGAIVVLALGMIWMYTRRGGMKALVWTDAVQTLCLVGAMVMILLRVAEMLGMSFGDAMGAVWNDPHSRMFEFGDWTSKQYFWKQFLSGVFVVIVMTGLDQDMMQKNLTCKSLKDAQKDMCTYGLLFAPVNFMFLALGVLLMMLYGKLGMELPEKGDALLTDVVLNGTLGTGCLVLFTIGVIASAFSSADSALTALTTTVTVDLLGKEKDEKVRKWVHVAVMVVFVGVTWAFHEIGSGSVMDLIYTLVSYTYGPLLGLFAFGMMTKWEVKERFVPWVCVGAPMVCLIVDFWAMKMWGYRFGYEMLMVNGGVCFGGLWLSRRTAENGAVS